jgi:hypothetical protein
VLDAVVLRGTVVELGNGEALVELVPDDAVADGLNLVTVPVASCDSRDEYVPREQSDALAAAVEAWDRDRMLDAVKAYREATAGEDEASG